MPHSLNSFKSIFLNSNDITSDILRPVPYINSNIALFLASNGVSIVGGCCGTTPEHIKLLVKKIYEKNLIDKSKIDFFINQNTKEKNNSIKICSNTKVVKIGKDEIPALIGERINPTGKKRFKQALRENDIQYILQEGIKQEENGCHILDVNVGLPEIDETKMMIDVIKENYNTIRW